MRTNGSKPGWPRLFPPTYLQRQGVPGARVGRGAARGRSGAFWRRFGAFWAIFSHFWRKAKDPLPRELNPRLPPYFAGGVTKIPGPWSCCRETGPEPPGSGFGGIIRSSFLSGADSARLAAKSGPCWVTVRPSRIRAREKWGVSAEKSAVCGNRAPPRAPFGESESLPCHSARATGSILGTSSGLRARSVPNSYLTLPCISRKSFSLPKSDSTPYIPYRPIDNGRRFFSFGARS